MRPFSRGRDGNALKPKRERGWWYPWLFVGGMLLVIAVNAVLITLAIGTFPGLQTEEYYRKGLAYNEALAAAEEQSRLGWQVTIEFRAQEDRAGELIVQATDRDGSALDGLQIEARLIRPTHEGYDRSVVLEEGGEGRYRRHLTVPLAGQWDVRVVASRDGQRYQDTRRIMIP